MPFDPALPDVETTLDFLTGWAARIHSARPSERPAADPHEQPRRWGTGLEIVGRAADLMMTVSGRRAVFDLVTGSGLADLASRL
jgi:hypothetical protein